MGESVSVGEGLVRLGRQEASLGTGAEDLVFTKKKKETPAIFK